MARKAKFGAFAAGMWADKKPYFLGSSMYNKDLGANHGDSSAKSKVKDPVVVFEEKEGEEDLSKENDLKTFIVRMSIPDWLKIRQRIHNDPERRNSNRSHERFALATRARSRRRGYCKDVRPSVDHAPVHMRMSQTLQSVGQLHHGRDDDLRSSAQSTTGRYRERSVIYPFLFAKLPILKTESTQGSSHSLLQHQESPFALRTKPKTSVKTGKAACEALCRTCPVLPRRKRLSTKGKRKLPSKLIFRAEFTAKIQSEIKSRGLQDEPCVSFRWSG